MFFERITKDNIAIIGDFLKENTFSCEFTPANLLLWAKTYNTQFAVLDDTLCICYEESNGPIFALIGGNVCDKLEQISEYCVEKNIVPKISLNQEQLGNFDEISAKFDIFESEKSAEYIYSTEALSNLSGKKYHSKRNHISAFSKQYNWTFEPLTQENKNEILEISDSWINSNKNSPETLINADRDGIEMLINNFKPFRAKGGIVRVDGQAVAFCLGTQVSEKVFDINFEKALPEYKGAYAVINREFAKTLSDYDYINREDDLGKVGLRKAKLSYHPQKILKKYIVMPKFIKEQAIKLYLDNFLDENERSANKLFDKLFLYNCLLKIQDKKVVSMLFAIDATVSNTEAAYIYGAATDAKYRKRGFMKELLDFANEKYDTLYLKPANDNLFAFYQKLGFKTAFYKKEIIGLSKNNNIEVNVIQNSLDLTKIREALSNDISVHLCDDAIDYILENYTAVTDSIENPQNFALFSIENDKMIINEVLSKGDCSAFLGTICHMYNCSEYAGFTVGEQIPCGMIKSKIEFPEKMYMGLDID